MATSAPAVKVFNLTDVVTPTLKQRGLGNRSLQVGSQLITPGQSASFDGATWTSIKTRYAKLLSLGALFVGAVAPAGYVAAKQRQAGNTMPVAKPVTPPVAPVSPGAPNTPAPTPAPTPKL